MKKSLLILVVTVFMAASIGSAFAGPFSDVPKSHWAYEAVNSLAAKGLLEGYADGKFKGAKAMTRYEMALMVARLIDKKFGGADFDTLQKLTVEFADELALLGVKVQALEEEVKVVRNDVDALKSDVDMLKKGGLGKIKLTIEDRIRFEDNKYKSLNAGVADLGNSRFVNRLRLNIKGNIDDNVSTFISLQDSTVHGTGIQNNANAGGNNVTAADTFRDLYLGYVDIKNFGGEVIDNARIGRMTLTIGKAFIFDNEVDGLMLKKHYRGTNFSLGGFDTRFRSVVDPLSPFSANNDGLDSKLFTVDHSWTNISAGAYYFTKTSAYQNVLGVAGNMSLSAMNVAGLTLDGKIGKSVVAFLEYADMSPAKNKDLYTATPVVAKWKGKGFKFGGEWTVNPTWDLTLMYQDREKDFAVLSLNDDYTDSAYAGNGIYANCGAANTTYARNGGGSPNYFPLTGVVDTYNNAQIMSLVIGYKATEKLNLDLWYEDMKGKDKLNAAGTLTGNFDQSTVQLASVYQYRENTAFKLRYRTTKYKTGDADYVNLGAGNGPADYDQVRLDLNVKF